MPSCDLLYSKALEFCKDDATLFSNRAMVYLNLGKARRRLQHWAPATHLESSIDVTALGGARAARDVRGSGKFWRGLNIVSLRNTVDRSVAFG